MLEAKIMIVEDEAILATDLRNQLQTMGYSVTAIASSKEKALQRIAEDPPDLVLMDIRIKGRADGIDTAREIKARYGIPVIYLTAYADETFLERAKITEPFGYMIKPVETRELHSTIEISLYKVKMDRERERLIIDLENALAEVKTLRGFLPICANCKKIRDDEGYWQRIEKYIEDRSDAQFSHSICPECSKQLYPDLDIHSD